MLTQFFLNRTIENILNSYLHLKQASSLPGQLVGKTLGVHLRGLSLTFYIIFAEQKIYVSQGLIYSPDLMISAPPFTLLSIATQNDISQALQEPELELKGDATLALTFKQFLDKLEIDWEHYFSLILGPSIGTKTQSLLRQCRQQAAYKHQSCETNLRDYLQYELSLTPTPQDLEDFYQQIDELKMAVDLCTSRLQHLQKRFKNRR